MKTRIVVCLFVMLFISSLVMADLPSFPICVDPSFQQSSPAISGDNVVWTDSRSGIENIYGYNLSTNTEVCFYPSSSSQQIPKINGDIVIWRENLLQEYQGIFGYNISSNTIFSITKMGFSPDIDNKLVVYMKHVNDQDIYGYDLSTNIEFPICTNEFNQQSPAINGNIVAWVDLRNEIAYPRNRDIYGYDLSTMEEFPICTFDGDQLYPDINGNIIVWQDNRNGNNDIYGYDLSINTEFPICINEADQYDPRISGDIVVYHDYREGIGVYGYNLTTRTEFPISTKKTSYSPDIDGNIIVWDGFHDVYGAYIPEPSTWVLLITASITLISCSLAKRENENG